MDFMKKLMEKIQHFMRGRYGVDQLGIAILALALVLTLISSFFNIYFLSVIGIALIGWCYYRILSRRVYNRQQENYKFLRKWHPVRNWSIKKVNRIKGMKTHKYFKCPNCKQTLRVPRGKGNIKVICPKCNHEMHKKS